jgi:uncharacterized protein
MSSPRVADLISELALQPHPEGGWYREIYRSPMRVETPRGPRAVLTTIYYLLERNQLSRWHVVQSDELWHFYAGAPLELLAYAPPTRQFERYMLGDVTGVRRAAGQPVPTPVSVIPTGVWQAARSLGDYSLLGCTVGPGFEFADFQFVSAVPAHADHFKGALAPFAHLL